MLAVIEGLDGSGKSTQVRLLRSWLEERCNDVEYIHFPRYDAPVYGDLISRFLRGEFGANDQVHPRLVALLYAEDRHGAAPRMREVLDRGGVVLLDRYVYSNIAYQCAKVPDMKEREALRRWIFDTEYGDFNLPEPDINIFLDVPEEFQEERLASFRAGSDRTYLHGASDIHEKDLGFQEKVRDVYLSQCAIDPHFVRIDCSDANGKMLGKDEIFDRIKSLIEGKIG